MRSRLSIAVFAIAVLSVGIVMFPNHVLAVGQFLQVCVIVVLPNAALYLVPAYLFYLIFPRSRCAGALALSVATLLALGLSYNAYRDYEADVEISASRSQAVASTQKPFLLAFQDTVAPKGPAARTCDDLCLRMLLKKNTPAYATVTVTGIDQLLSMEDRNIAALRIRDGAPCGNIPFAGNLYENGPGYISSEQQKTIMAVNPEFAMKRMERSGTCLEEHAVAFADFGTVIYVGRNRSFHDMRQHRGLFYPSANRTIDVYVRNGGKLESVFRNVTVFSDRLALPPLIEPSDYLLLQIRQALDTFGFPVGPRALEVRVTHNFSSATGTTQTFPTYTRSSSIG